MYGTDKSKFSMMTLISCAIFTLLISVSTQVTADEEVALEEVIVQATKKDVAIEDLAAAANVLGADALGPGGIQSARDMYASIPNMSIGDQFGFARVFMRGIGMTSIDIGGEGAVSFLQDGAIIPRPASQLVGMFDLDQVEVLRGPQGTLYGRGATAGVINMVTSKPGDEIGGYANLTIGNYSTTIFEGAVDLPLSADFSMRIATKLEKRDGYGENLFSGEEVDDRDAQAYRVTFAYSPDANWNATLSAQYYEEDDKNYAFHYFGPSEGNPLGPLGVPILGGRTVSDVGGDIYDINSDQEAINTREADNITLTLNFDLSAKSTLRSISSVQSLDRFLRDDLDSTDANLFGQNNYTEESESFGQEFVYNYDGDNFDLLAGAMYFDEELFGIVLVPLTNICFLLAPATCGTPIGDGLNSGRFEQNGTVDIEAYGAFAEGTWAISEQFEVIAGVRYNYEKRKGTGSFIFNPIGADISTDKQESWNDVTPRLTLQYHPTNDSLAYATFTQAFKSGAINTGNLGPPVNPETVDAFEIGYKASTEDGRIKYSLSAFYYDYQDLQISFVDEQSTVLTVNAAQAENYGIEFELNAALGNGFGIDLFATYLNAEFKEFVNGDYANGFVLTDLSGNVLPNAPEYTAKLGLSYEAETGFGAIHLRGEVYYQDDVYFTEWNRTDAFQESYMLLNASADFLFADSAWQASIWGRNLADEEIISNNIITAPLYNSVRVGSLLPPLTFGVSLAYRF
jgi:iron complex outermembrane receptor protein